MKFAALLILKSPKKSKAKKVKFEIITLVKKVSLK